MITVKQRFEINYIDPSSISAFNRCPALYLFSRLMGLKKQDAKTIAMDYGTDMHRAFPHCYNGIAGLKTAMDEFKLGWNAREYGDDDDKRNRHTAAASLEEFCNKQEYCPYKILHFDIAAPTFDRISPNEVPFLIDIGGELSLAGRMDAIVEWRTDNAIWGHDYKTTNEISARYFDNFYNSPQAVGYTLATSHIVGGRKVNGLIIEAVRVSKKNVESQIGLIFVREHQIESFIRFANRTSENILRCNEAMEWPKKGTGCAPYAMFGQPGRVCDYKEICDCPDWESMVRYYKKVEPFHPFRMKK